MKICINAGHCLGVDPGAIGQRGTQEAKITAIIASHIKNYLEGKGYAVISISDKSLARVCQTSNKNKCDYFISVHCNAAENRNARGTETFYYKGSAKGKRLAQEINDEIVRTLKTTNRGIKENTSFYVLKNTKAPAVLVETAFISNPEDEKLLIEKANIFAQAIVRGLIKGIER